VGGGYGSRGRSLRAAGSRSANENEGESMKRVHGASGFNGRGGCPRASVRQLEQGSAAVAACGDYANPIDGGPRSGWRRYRGDTKWNSAAVAGETVRAMRRGGESVIAIGVSTPLANKTTAQSCSPGFETGCDLACSGHVCAPVVECSQLCAVGQAASIVKASTNAAHNIASARCSEPGPW
jgi:hypothetical protein